MESQQNNIENQKSNSSLKAIIVVLALLLLGSLAYMYKMSNDNEKIQKGYVSDKDKLVNDLEAAKESYDAAIAENTGLKGDLEAERAKIVELLEKVKKADGTVASLAHYKTDYVKLKREHDALLAEVKRLKAENGNLTTQRDSTRSALDESKKFIDTLATKNDNLSRTVEKAQKLSLVNLKAQPFKERNSGKLVETEKARRVDVIKISFTIAANEVAMAGDKQYYVQVIDPKNNVIGEKKTESFGEYTLTYSFITNATYQNKNMDVTQTVKGQDFAKGLYTVNVFDKGVAVANSTFTLK
jgi:predicted nuclease with TOPRIM domain